MTRTTVLLGLGVFAAAGAIAGTASAAAPAYCALYSREYAIDTVQPQAAAGMLESVQNQAYYRCLNQDEDPPLPQESAYFGTDLRKLTDPPESAAAAAADLAKNQPATSTAKAQNGASASSATTTVTASVAPDVVIPPTPQPAPKPPAKAPVVKAKASAQAPYHGSGKAAWTPEWKAWCADNFPNSWDPDTGTILHYGSGTRELCK